MKTFIKILLVEDDNDDQALFFQSLELIASRIECTIANNGVEAISILDSQQQFDIIFLDLNMPVMNGYDCLQKIKLKTFLTGIPIIVCTTSVQSRDRNYCMQMGATSFFTKPCSFPKFCTEVKEILEISVK